MAEQNFGPKDLRVATSLQDVALIYSAQRDFAAAEPPAQRALKILESAATPDQAQIDPARCGFWQSERRRTLSKLADASAVRFVDLGSAAAIR